MKHSLGVFLVVFIILSLLSSTVTADMFGSQVRKVRAQEHDWILTERGANFEKYRKGNLFKWVSAPLWIWNGSSYVPHIYVDKFSTEGYVQVQTGMIAARIYSGYATFYDPNMTEVRLYQEQWEVQRFNPNNEKWRSVIGSYSTFEGLLVEKDERCVNVTVTYSSWAGWLNITYSFTEGEALKHMVVFKSDLSDLTTFRVLQKWSGIVGEKVKHHKGKDTVSSTKIINSTWFLFEKADGKLSILENQWHMRNKLQPVEVDVHAQGMKANFVFSNWTLNSEETLTIDPSTTTNYTPPSKDSHIDSVATTTNYGSETTLEVYAGANDRRALLEFSSLPTGITVLSATLKLYCVAPESTRTLRIQRMTGSWTELGVTWDNQPTVDSNYVDVAAPSGAGWWNVSVTDIYVVGSTIGFRIMDSNETEATYTQSFSSKEGTNDPMLTVTYTYTPSIGEFQAPSTVYANKYFFLNATINDADGVAEFVNATVELSNSIILKWDNATDTFSEYQDPNGYCTLDAANSLKTSVNSAAYKLSWKIKLAWTYPEGSVNVVAANTKVFDRNDVSGSNSKTGLFTFEDDLEVASDWPYGALYRKSHVIQNATGAGTDYQIRIICNYGSGTDNGEVVYLDGKCNPDFTDIFFTKSDGVTKYKSFLRTVQTHTTFYPYSAVCGWLSRNVPVGFYHNNKTFIVFEGNNADIYAIVYFHENKSWSDPVYVADNPPVADFHGTPAMVRDNNGYLHVFYGAHDSAIRYARSNYTDSISAWTYMGTVGYNISTYTQVVVTSNNSIYVFSRKTVGNGHKVLYWFRSDDGGDTWVGNSTVNTLVDFGDTHWIYNEDAKYDATRNVIHLAWFDNQRTSDGGRYRNIYHAYLNLTDSHIYSMNSTDLGKTINQTISNQYCLVYNSTSYCSWAPVIQLDSNGYPYIIFAYTQSDQITDLPLPAENSSAMFTRWNGTQWLPAVEINGWGVCFHNDFYLIDDNNIVAYIGNGTSNYYNGAIEEWRSYDRGVTWTKIQTIREEIGKTTGIETIHLIENFSDELKLVFSGWTGYMGGATPSYAHGTDFQNGIFWVKIDEDLSEQNQTMYIYYGSDSYSSVGNASETFVLYEPFDSLTGWTIEEYGDLENITLVNGTVQFERRKNVFCHIEQAMTYDNVAISVEIKRPGYTSATWSPGLAVWFNDYDYASIKMTYTSKKMNIVYDKGGAVTSVNVNASAWNSDEWENLEIRLTPSEIFFYYKKNTEKNWQYSYKTSRAASWDTPDLVIIGTGHEDDAGSYPNPDFDNSATPGEIIGSPSSYAERAQSTMKAPPRFQKTSPG